MTSVGGFEPCIYVDIASRRPRPPRPAKDGALGRLRCLAGRAQRANGLEESGSDARANAPGGSPPAQVAVFDGGFGPHVTIDIASRSLWPRRGRLRGNMVRLQCSAKRLAAGARQSAHELSFMGLEYQRRPFGAFRAQKCVYQTPHTAGQLLSRCWCCRVTMWLNNVL